MSARFISVIIMSLLVSITEITPVHAADSSAPKARGQAARTPAAAQSTTMNLSGRKKNLSFEDEMVEGMNKNPLDSLENLAQKDGDNNGHLYRKRKHFKKEMPEVAKEVGFSP